MITKNQTAATLAHLLEARHPSLAFRLRELRAMSFAKYAGEPLIAVSFLLDARSDAEAMEISADPIEKGADAIAARIRELINRPRALVAGLNAAS